MLWFWSFFFEPWPQSGLELPWTSSIDGDFDRLFFLYSGDLDLDLDLEGRFSFFLGIESDFEDERFFLPLLSYFLWTFAYLEFERSAFFRGGDFETSDGDRFLLFSFLGGDLDAFERDLFLFLDCLIIPELLFDDWGYPCFPFGGETDLSGE